MLFRASSFWIAAGLALALWAINSAHRDSGSWVRPVGSPPGAVKILQFYASVGLIHPGEKAMLCYGVENAKAVQISPDIAGVYPAYNRCLEVEPERTTHYTIFATGFDGRIATQSLTLPVSAPISRALRVAGISALE
jgi:hypothetical protein